MAQLNSNIPLQAATSVTKSTASGTVSQGLNSQWASQAFGNLGGVGIVPVPGQYWGTGAVQGTQQPVSPLSSVYCVECSQIAQYIYHGDSLCQVCLTEKKKRKNELEQQLRRAIT